MVNGVWVVHVDGMHTFYILHVCGTVVQCVLKNRWYALVEDAIYHLEKERK